MQLQSRFPLILLALLAIIPQTIYIIGNHLGTGIAWPFVRYQETYLGTSIIPMTRDLTIVFSGELTGKTSVSFCLWIIGAMVLAAAIILAAYDLLENEIHSHTLGLATFCAGCLFLLSSLVQYGILFSGPAGTVIPVGLPLVFVSGWWIYFKGDEDPEKETES